MEEAFTSSQDTENKIEYKFAELFDLNEIQKLQDSFSAATGVASIITEPDGTPITRGMDFADCGSEINK
jgi:ligand-binding sensor protein